MKFIAGFILIISVVSCLKTDPEPMVPDQSSGIRLTVKNNYTDTSGILMDSLIPNSTVSLFASEDDRTNHISLGEKTTDTNGVVRFDHLTLSHYWLTIQHPVFGIKEEDVSTPPKSVSLVEIIF